MIETGPARRSRSHGAASGSTELTRTRTSRLGGIALINRPLASSRTTVTNTSRELLRT
ncbi:Uncharacterised protein [Mycobacterium tuberculosis]|uniref:Uncharacterized protein n=1 Tax=Mycobacterium tuberculosis TaxID=1773 RepID=A0A916LD67_MYCTX|nr:Uncharacterised protein [Mycobacterium tuberculosis]COZ08740.1 Uncharacterised protein [Mycobacterium tuberculosis]